MKETRIIHFEANLITLGNRDILRLPEEASAELPSRGQVAVQGKINGYGFRTVLEPDGSSGHWMRIEPDLQEAAALDAARTAVVTLQITKDWPEPDVPADLSQAIGAAPPKVQEKWKEITPMARWEWVRWVNETRNPQTRAVRIEKTISKLNGNHRRPCCFNLAACTDPELSRSGKLIDASRAG